MKFKALKEAVRYAGRSSRPPLWLLVLITLSGTMAMHIFIPALPVAGEALSASSASMQLTITLYVVGLALGQLIYGPLSDAVGRRPALLLGLGVYFFASILALLATTVQWLVMARLLQALGGAAGLTLGRAIVRDVANPSRVTKDMALLNLLTLLGPGLAPIVGSYLADHFGWRSIYVFLVLLGCAMLLSTYRLLGETHPERSTLQMRSVLGDYVQLLANERFATLLLGGSCISAALYPYLASAPYIINVQMGLPISTIGWFAASTIVGASVGTYFTRRLSDRWNDEKFLVLGAGLSLSMAGILLILHFGGWLTPLGLLIVTVVMTLGAGMAGPASMSSALSVMPGLTGSAAGLYGFGQMGMGALGTFAVGFYAADPVIACGVTQICVTGAAYWSFHRVLERSRIPKAPRRSS